VSLVADPAGFAGLVAQAERLAKLDAEAVARAEPQEAERERAASTRSTGHSPNHAVVRQDPPRPVASRARSTPEQHPKGRDRRRRSSSG
jgi:hypothetical protein